MADVVAPRTLTLAPKLKAKILRQIFLFSSVKKACQVMWIPVLPLYWNLGTQVRSVNSCPTQSGWQTLPRTLMV